MLLQIAPSPEAVLNAPATAVLGLVTVLLAVALALTLKALLLRKSVDPDELARLWAEVDRLRNRSHLHASKITTLLLRVRIPEAPEDEE